MSVEIIDGVQMTDEGGHDWIACCGTWWGESAWSKPSSFHGFLPADHQGNCPTCARSLRRNDANRTDVEEYESRLSETQSGEWLRVGPVFVGAGASKRIQVVCPESVLISHLAFPESVATSIRVLDMRAGMRTVLEGPLPGEFFAVRIPKNARKPIDRGGVIGKEPFMLYVSMICFVTVENRTSVPIEVLGALFGTDPRPATLSVVTPIRGVEKATERTDETS